jgi:hypothetical protein
VPRLTFATSPVSARHSTPHHDRPISLVDSIRVVLFLIVPVDRTGAALITINIERNKTRADFASVLASPRLAIQRAGAELRRDDSRGHIERLTRQATSRFENCDARLPFVTSAERPAQCVPNALGTATELCATNDDAGHRLLFWLSRLMTSRQETAPLFRASGEAMQLPPGDELIRVSAVTPIRAHKARCFEDRRLPSRTPPAPALTLPGAGASGDRPDLPADDWTALSLTPPVAAAAIGSVVGHMPNSRVHPKSKHEANVRSPAKQVQP